MALAAPGEGHTIRQADARTRACVVPISQCIAFQPVFFSARGDAVHRGQESVLKLRVVRVSLTT